MCPKSQMTLIAESGSTKTDWRLIRATGIPSRPQPVESFTTPGFNPFHADRKDLESGIHLGLPPSVNPDQIRNIFYYGAGCSSEERCSVVASGLKSIFPQSSVEVHHDLLAAARAAFHRESGMVVILGTGSNTGLYDGQQIIKSFPPLGYILGDVGSGAHLGIALVKAYLNRELPSTLHDLFRQQYGLDKEEILDRVYCQEAPNRFLASFSKFLHENISHPFIAGLVYSGLSEIFDKRICKYDGYEKLRIRFVGSIAHHFESALKKIAQDKGATVDRILEFPIDELVKFHVNELN